MLLLFFFFLIRRRPPRSPPFPSTTLSRSARHADIGVARLARAVDHTAHHRDLDRLLDPLQVLLHPLGQRDQVDLDRSEEHTSELQSRQYLVCRLLLEKKK